MLHSSLKSAQAILNYVEKLYDEVSKSEDPDTIKYLSGKIFWWLCQAKPWLRGDPSISEMLIRSIWVTKGLASPSWESDLIPWVETVIDTDPENFGNNFHKLFKGGLPWSPETTTCSIQPIELTLKSSRE